MARPRWRRAAWTLFFLICLALVSLVLPLSPLGSSSGLKPQALLGRVYHASLATENAADENGVEEVREEEPTTASVLSTLVLPVAVDGSSEEEEEEEEEEEQEQPPSNALSETPQGAEAVEDGGGGGGVLTENPLSMALPPSTLRRPGPLPPFVADAYKFSSYANWVIPGRLLVGRYPGVDPTQCTSATGCAEERLRELTTGAGVRTWISMQRETPPQFRAVARGGGSGGGSHNGGLAAVEGREEEDEEDQKLVAHLEWLPEADAASRYHEGGRAAIRGVAIRAEDELEDKASDEADLSSGYFSAYSPAVLRIASESESGSGSESESAAEVVGVETSDVEGSGESCVVAVDCGERRAVSNSTSGSGDAPPLARATPVAGVSPASHERSSGRETGLLAPARPPAAAAAHRFVHLPLTDLTAPTPEQLERFVATVVAALSLEGGAEAEEEEEEEAGEGAREKKEVGASPTMGGSILSAKRHRPRKAAPKTPGVVYLHCWGGKGRSGTVAAAVLSYLHPDASVDEVLERLDTAFRTRGVPGETPETDEQRDVLRGFIDKVKRLKPLPPPTILPAAAIAAPSAATATPSSLSEPFVEVTPAPSSCCRTNAPS